LQITKKKSNTKFELLIFVIDTSKKDPLLLKHDTNHTYSTYLLQKCLFNIDKYKRLFQASA